MKAVTSAACRLAGLSAEGRALTPLRHSALALACLSALSNGQDTFAGQCSCCMPVLGGCQALLIPNLNPRGRQIGGAQHTRSLPQRHRTSHTGSPPPCCPGSMCARTSNGQTMGMREQRKHAEEPQRNPRSHAARACARSHLAANELIGLWRLVTSIQ